MRGATNHQSQAEKFLQKENARIYGFSLMP